jgi:hypothetical protein
MLLGKFVHKPFDVICLGPNAWNDDVTRRMIERATPRAVIVVVDSVTRNGVDLRTLGDKIRIEPIEGRVRLNVIRVALAQARVELSGFTVREPLIREPHCKKPRNVKVSGFPSPRCFRFRSANCPNSISRVFSACNCRPNFAKALLELC